MSATSRIAVVVGGGAITGRRYPTSIADLLRMGARYVNASPELDRLKDVVRDWLLVAGRDAALAVAECQLEALTQRMTVHVEKLEKLQVPAWTTIETISAAPLAVLDAVLEPDTRAADVAPPDGVGGEAVGTDTGDEDWTVEPVMVAVLDDPPDQHPQGLEQRPGAPTDVPERAFEGATA